MVMTVTVDLIIPLFGTPASVGLARTLVDARIRKWNYFHILDNALLVVSELVTNAAEHTPHKELRLRLSRDAQGIVIAVWDGSPDLPRVKPKVDLTLETLGLSEDAFDDNGGRGLQIVRALSAACDVTRDPNAGNGYGPGSSREMGTFPSKPTSQRNHFSRLAG